MITSFKVKNFRLFDELEINKLSQVNLIVGKNNAGKSALLEALLLFFSKMSPTDLVDIIYARQENHGALHIQEAKLSILFVISLRITSYQIYSKMDLLFPHQITRLKLN